jgi:hypothetical protein
MKRVIFFMILLMLAAICVSVAGHALSDAANAMAARSWRPIFAGGSAHFRTGNANPIFIYSNDACWDPNTEKIMYLGSPHAQPWNMIIYTAETNTWRDGPLPSGIGSIHSYDCQTIDQEAGIMYFWNNDDPIYKFNPVSESWSTVSGSNGSATHQAYGAAMDYFPEMNALIWAEGGTVAKFSLSSNSWSSLGSKSMGGYHNLCEYNPVHKFMIVGGGNGSSTMHRLDASGNFTASYQAPMEIGINTGLLTCDPVTGDFLYLTDDNLYAWDVIDDTWEDLGVNPLKSTDDGHMAAVVVPIKEYGVVGFVSTLKFAFLLYKYAQKASVQDKPAKGSTLLELVVEPNPFNSSTTFKMNSRFKIEDCRLKIYDIKGKKLQDFTSKIKNQQSSILNQITWNPEHLPSGIYILRAQTGTGTISKKLFLQK